MIIHTLDKMVSVSVFERRGDSAEGCSTVEAVAFYAVAFGYVNNAIDGCPYKAGKIHVVVKGTLCIILCNVSLIHHAL